MDTGQTLTRHVHVNTTVQAVFTGNNQGADSDKINRIHREKQSIIINNNKSSSEQMKIQGAFPELKERAYRSRLMENKYYSLVTLPAPGIKPHSSHT